MKNIKWLPVLMVFSAPGFCQVGLNKVAQSTMNFQQVGVSAQAGAMGEAFCAVGRGSESIFYNPAGMVENDKSFDVKLYATQWIADINFMAGAAAWNMGNAGSLGLSFLAVDYGDIYSTALLDPSESALYPQGYKDLGLADNVGAWSVGLTYGRAISTQFFIAANVRLVGQNLGSTALSAGDLKQNNAAKLVFDAGVKYYTGLKSFRFAMAIRNFSSNIKREEIDEQLPITFTMGLAVNLFDFFLVDAAKQAALTLATDFVHFNNYTERIYMGMEYSWLNKIALRCGYQTNHDIASWSVGVGLHALLGENQISFDYSYSAFAVFDAVHRFSLGVGF